LNIDIFNIDFSYIIQKKKFHYQKEMFDKNNNLININVCVNIFLYS
jgi:hypothetical protein